MDSEVPPPLFSPDDSLSRLKAGQTFIEVTAPDETTEAEAAWLNQQLLSAEEQIAASRLHLARNRHDYIVAHALVRLRLSYCFPVTPRDWGFGRDSGNRPFVIGPPGLPPFQSNLSHTQGLAAVLITGAAHAGVDVEKIKNTGDLPLIATQIFAPVELASLSRLSGDAWVKRFFELWTLKEAYVKARGLGLTLPLKSIAFEIGSDNRPVVRFAPENNDETQGWQFWLRQISADHILAAAVRVPPGSPPSGIFLRTSRVGASPTGGWLEPLRAET